jgi:hypothetical protein
MIGQGEPKDDVQAYKWFTICLNNNTDPAGDSSRHAMIAVVTQQRDKLAEQMTPQQIASATQMAASWQPGGH